MLTIVNSLHISLV